MASSSWVEEEGACNTVGRKMPGKVVVEEGPSSWVEEEGACSTVGHNMVGSLASSSWVGVGVALGSSSLVGMLGSMILGSLQGTEVGPLLVLVGMPLEVVEEEPYSIVGHTMVGSLASLVLALVLALVVALVRSWA